MNVSLSTPSLAIDSCYISLVSQKALRIINHSDTPISFSWKSFANAAEVSVDLQSCLSFQSSSLR